MKCKRSSAFFGLHFDFHAVAGVEGVGTAPGAVWPEPGHRPAAFSFDGILHVTIDRLDLHTVIVCED